MNQSHSFNHGQDFIARPPSWADLTPPVEDQQFVLRASMPSTKQVSGRDVLCWTTVRLEILLGNLMVDELAYSEDISMWSH